MGKFADLVQYYVGKFGGKKFLAMIGSIIVILVHKWFGIPEQVLVHIEHIVIAYLIGQGVADGWTNGKTSHVVSSCEKDASLAIYRKPS